MNWTPQECLLHSEAEAIDARSNHAAAQTRATELKLRESEHALMQMRRLMKHVDQTVPLGAK